MAFEGNFGELKLDFIFGFGYVSRTIAAMHIMGTCQKDRPTLNFSASPHEDVVLDLSVFCTNKQWSMLRRILRLGMSGKARSPAL